MVAEGGTFLKIVNWYLSVENSACILSVLKGKH